MIGRAEGVSLEVAIPPGETGLEFSRRLMKCAERMVAEGRTYRGRVLSLEQSRAHSGKAGAIRVHKLRKDAAVFFVLTSNRPEQLEFALAASTRPSNSRFLTTPAATNLPNCTSVASRWSSPSAITSFRGPKAFPQLSLRNSCDAPPNACSKPAPGTSPRDHVHTALEELLFIGGTLNAKLLGARVEMRAGN